MLSFRIEQFLEIPKLLLVVRNLVGSRFVAVMTTLKGRIDLLEVDRSAGSNLESLEVFH
jgi:hypothetical protein